MATQTYYPAQNMIRTFDQIMAEWFVFTPEQRSLAWSPEPPREAHASDCRRGGACGLDYDSPHSRWVIARHRWNREQQKIGDAR